MMGKGDKQQVDQAAVDAMRQALDGVDMDGVVVIGEGERPCKQKQKERKSRGVEESCTSFIEGRNSDDTYRHSPEGDDRASPRGF
jgi:hypothetical protein